MKLSLTYFGKNNSLRVSDSRVLRGIFGPVMKLLEAEENYSGEIHNLYSTPNIIRIIEWRRMRWVWSRKYG
jgi:hypothetical protein